MSSEGSTGATLATGVVAVNELMPMYHSSVPGFLKDTMAKMRRIPATQLQKKMDARAANGPTLLNSLDARLVRSGSDCESWSSGSWYSCCRIAWSSSAVKPSSARPAREWGVRGVKDMFSYGSTMALDEPTLRRGLGRGMTGRR